MCKYFGNVAIETIYKASEVLLQYSDRSWYNLDHFTCFIGFIHGDDGDGDANALIPLHFNSSWPLFVQYNRLHAICRCTLLFMQTYTLLGGRDLRHLYEPFTASVWTIIVKPVYKPCIPFSSEIPLNFPDLIQMSRWKKNFRHMSVFHVPHNMATHKLSPSWERKKTDSIKFN